MSEVSKGSITTQTVDAIINAAGPGFRDGEDMDGAIQRTAGQALRRASIKLAPYPPGKSRITGPRRLQGQRLIHKD